jgi:tetratricopeptide (TPR) repeat protein
VSLRKVSDDKDTELADIAKKLSLDTMFAMLKLSDTMESAVVFEETIKEIWKAHENQELRLKLDNGVADLLRGNKERALDTFTKLVEDDPDYAEAWNKASTCHFMLGDMQLSLEMAERTLMLLPRHFQAMNGLGLVHCETRKYKLGARLFRQSLALDPWSPVSARLAVCKDMLHDADWRSRERHKTWLHTRDSCIWMI